MKKLLIIGLLTLGMAGTASAAEPEEIIGVLGAVIDMTPGQFKTMCRDIGGTPKFERGGPGQNDIIRCDEKSMAKYLRNANGKGAGLGISGPDAYRFRSFILEKFGPPDARKSFGDVWFFGDEYILRIRGTNPIVVVLTETN